MINLSSGMKTILLRLWGPSIFLSLLCVCSQSTAAQATDAKPPAPATAQMNPASVTNPATVTPRPADTTNSRAPAGAATERSKAGSDKAERSVLTDWIIGIVSGLISGFAVIILLSMIKPKLEISPEIAYKNGIFKVKLINRSRFFQAIDIRALFFRIDDQEKSHSIELLRDELPWIQKHRSEAERKKRGEHAEDDIWIFHTAKGQDLNSMLKDSSTKSFRFGIFCRHPFSSFSIYREQEYPKKSVIPDGDFAKGDDLRVITKDKSPPLNT